MIESSTHRQSGLPRPVSVWHLWLNPFAAAIMLAIVAWMTLVLVAVKLGEWWARRTGRRARRGE